MTILDKITAMKEMGASKTSANQMIRKSYEYKSYKEEIDTAITEVYGDTSQSLVDWETRVATIRNNPDLTKKELLALLVEQEDGHESSLRQMLGYIEMCKEWAKQETGE